MTDASRATPRVSERDDLVRVALGELPADLVIDDGVLVNVYTGEIEPAGVAILGDRIAAVGDVSRCVGSGTNHVDARGSYLVPGFIETHIHVGATSLPMTELARLLVPRGTAAIVTDFTEAGKMQGKAAMRFFLDEAARTPLTAYFSPFYTTLLGIEGRPGVSFEDFEEMLGWPECVEVREWNLYAQRHPDERLRVLGDVARRHGLLLCGHMEGQAGAVLQSSVAAGAMSDHEAATPSEALERLRLGLALQVRFSSGADNMDVLRAIADANVDTRGVMFATDEEDIDEIARLGHIDHRVRVAIECGIPPMDAIRMATLNPATYLGKTADFGGIAPGRKAFISLVDDLERCSVRAVVAGAGVVAVDGSYVAPLDAPEYPRSFRSTVHLGRAIDASAFRVPAGRQQGAVEALVMAIEPYRVRTKVRRLELPVEDGNVRADVSSDVAKIAVLDRHFASGKVGVGFVQGFGLARGAVGSSYHPGPVQLGVVGTSDRDMAVVANRIAEIQGGFVVVADGAVVAEVPLPLLGFLSDRRSEDVVEAFRRVKEAVRVHLGSTFGGVFTALAYACMPGVLPEIRMTIHGPVRVEAGGERLTVQPLATVQGADSRP